MINWLIILQKLEDVIEQSELNRQEVGGQRFQ